jgi:octaprenyl-diphosphate synthase
MALAATIARQDDVAELSFGEAAARLKTSQSRELEAVNGVILDHLASSVPLIPEVARHLIGAGGKRLRPLLTLAAAELCGGRGEAPRLLAAAVELIHAATLLHDDVVDDSELRRGLLTANVVFGNKESVLVGDFLFARAFELMVETGSLDVLRVLSAASCTISEGEVLQLGTQGNPDTSHEMYLAVVEAKTAALFSAATRSGASVAGGSSAAVEALAEYGMAFGIAYQMTDDALDYEGRDASLGKHAGDDFREGKVTLPVILAIEGARTPEERAFWRRTIGEGVQAEGDFARAQALMERDDLVGRSLAVAQEYAVRAASSLGGLPRSPLRDTLEALALASTARSS